METLKAIIDISISIVLISAIYYAIGAGIIAVWRFFGYSQHRTVRDWLKSWHWGRPERKSINLQRHDTDQPWRGYQDLSGLTRYEKQRYK